MAFMAPKEHRPPRMGCKACWDCRQLTYDTQMAALRAIPENHPDIDRAIREALYELEMRVMLGTKPPNS